ncbi:MAG: CBO0543 family protein [Tumebacillaceae bacterium]
MVFVLVFLSSWVAFICLADRKRFREIFTTSLMAMVLGLTSDLIIEYVPIWHYQDPVVPTLLIKVLDDFGLYFVVSYLYIQFLPVTFKKWLLYTLLWTLSCISFETIMLKSGRMQHEMGWSLWSSYVADWVILGFLTTYHLWSSHSRAENAIVYDMADIVCVKDAQGRWMVANHAVLSLLQLQETSYRGKTDLELAEMNEFHRETFKLFREHDKKTWENGLPCRYQLLIPQPSGPAFLEVTKVPTFDAKGNRKGMLVLARHVPGPINSQGRSLLKPAVLKSL